MVKLGSFGRTPAPYYIDSKGRERRKGVHRFLFIDLVAIRSGKYLSLKMAALLTCQNSFYFYFFLSFHLIASEKELIHFIFSFE